MKRQNREPQEILRDFRDKDGDWKPINSLPDGTKLNWVPSWEGVLQYAPDDLRNDKPLRFWHVFYSKRFKRTIRIRLHRTIGYHGRNQDMRRFRISFLHRGKHQRLYTSHLTELCKTGFAIADRRHWVVDHIDNNQLNDRPSNLQVISARENVRRSEKVKEIIQLTLEERTHRRLERMSVINKLRSHIIASLGPDATRNDVELELALQIQERGL